MGRLFAPEAAEPEAAEDSKPYHERLRALLPILVLLMLGACASLPPPAPDPVRGAVSAWKCDSGSTFSTQWTAGGNIEVIAGGNMYWLPAKKAGSGARYINKKVEFSEKGGAAMLNGAAGGPYANCTL